MNEELLQATKFFWRP